MPADLGNDVRRERHRLEIVDGKQAGAQAVVDVMGVIGNVVGDGGNLRLERGKAPELQIVLSDVVGNADGNAMLAVSADRRAVALGQGPVVLDDAFERLPGQVEPVEIGIAVFQRGHDPQRLGIMVEAAMRLQAGIQRPLAGVAERRVAEVMGQRQRLGEVLVEPELARQRAGDLGHFQGMRQAGAVMIALVEHEHLGLVLEPAKGGGMDHPVAIPAKRAAGAAWRLRKQPPPALVGIAGKRRAGGSHSDRHGNLILIHLIPLTGALNYGGRGIPNELGMTPALIRKSGHRFSEKIMLRN